MFVQVIPLGLQMGMSLGSQCHLYRQKMKKSSCLKPYGHVAYQIKGNEAYNNMLANILILHLPLTPGVGSKGYIDSFSESSHVALSN